MTDYKHLPEWAQEILEKLFGGKPQSILEKYYDYEDDEDDGITAEDW